MKLFVFAVVVAVAAADYYSGSLPSSFAGESRLLKPTIPILSYSASSDNTGTYQFASEGGDGTRVSESGAQVLLDKESGATKRGSFSWTSPEGKAFSLSYVADETGFHPVGDHLPQSPPIPEEIAKVLPLLPKLSSEEMYGYAEKPSAPLSFASYAAPQYSSYGSLPAVRPPTFLVAPPAPPTPQDLLVPVLGVQRLEAPLETHVRTSDFSIDTDAAGSKIRIGAV